MRAYAFFGVMLFATAILTIPPSFTQDQLPQGQLLVHEGGEKEGSGMVTEEDDGGVLFEYYAKGRPYFLISEAHTLPILWNPLMQFAQQKGITTGQISRQEFVEFRRLLKAGAAGQNYQEFNEQLDGRLGSVGSGGAGMPSTLPGGLPSGPGGAAPASAGKSGTPPKSPGGLPSPGGNTKSPQQNQDAINRQADADFKRRDVNGDGKLSSEDVVHQEEAKAKANPSPTIVIIDEENWDRIPTVLRAGKLPAGLPSWFNILDTDGDGQIGLYEWRAAGKPLEEFAKYDLDDNGFIEPEEVLRVMRRPIEFKHNKNEVLIDGAVEEETENRYQGKKSFKILTVKLNAGKTYHFTMNSKDFQAFLYLEDSSGKVLTENSASSVGGISRIEYRASKAGDYRVIATSLGGFRTGPFVLSIRR
jgi:hypothetical protein